MKADDFQQPVTSEVSPSIRGEDDIVPSAFTRHAMSDELLHDIILVSSFSRVKSKSQKDVHDLVHKSRMITRGVHRRAF